MTWSPSHMDRRVVSLAQGIWQVQLPAPFPLQTVHAYVFRGREGIDILDTGLHNDETVAMWEGVQKMLHFAWTDVRSIVLTHHHPDHAGLAGWMQTMSEAPVWATAETQRQMIRLWGDEAAVSCAQWMHALLRHGWPQGQAEAMHTHLHAFSAQVNPLPHRWHLLCAGGDHPLGDDTYVVCDTPGHAWGHVSFLHEPTGRMFCGDHVLQGITPNVSWTPFADADPLQAYMDSLARAKQWHVTCAYAGHRAPIEAYADRIEAITVHHQQRLDLIEAMMDAPTDAYTCGTQLFKRGLTVHQWRFALSEVIAHFVHLEATGRVVRDETTGIERFVKR